VARPAADSLKTRACKARLPRQGPWHPGVFRVIADPWNGWPSAFRMLRPALTFINRHPSP
jgi:hypothetical protein